MTVSYTNDNLNTIVHIDITIWYDKFTDNYYLRHIHIVSIREHRIYNERLGIVAEFSLLFNFMDCWRDRDETFIICRSKRDVFTLF